ncbi:SMC protein [Tritrichomonas foetus]|uniref:SMC protein n=1 Tax=Tritrichomonas foetus TaxID=1144522 RepID=A0A1J4JIE7_9EUKA|nr:SMC protein [Tritrichomonas foetus]|eukprot:OHS97301.1 SMC protein [Tritrichomonas foetus]
MSDIETYKKEIDSLNRQLVLLGEARNQEILDLQHRFADRIRELEKSKGFDKFDEITALKTKISELEAKVAAKETENQDLKNHNNELQKQLKEANESHEKTSFLLEKARIEILKTKSEAPPEIDFEEMLKPLEDQLNMLKGVVTQKQAEIKRLQQLVHEECQERMRLQSLLGINTGKQVNH